MNVSHLISPLVVIMSPTRTPYSTPAWDVADKNTLLTLSNTHRFFFIVYFMGSLWDFGNLTCDKP